MEECPFSLLKERLMALLLLLCLMTMAQSDPSSDRRTGWQTTMTPDHRIHMVVPKPNFTGPYQRDTVLTCHFFFEQMVPPESISVNWWRNESGSQRIIYAFEHGRRQMPKEDPAYSYRTDLYYNLTLGDASLKIQDLSLKDTGLYVCEAWSEGYSSHGVGSVNLSVVARPSKQGSISMEDTFLSYNSSGWLPPPSVFWTDENDQNVTEVTQTNVTLGEDGLYSIRTILYPNPDWKLRHLHLSYTNPDTGEEQTDILLQGAMNTEIHVVIPDPHVTGPYQGEAVLQCRFFFDNKVPDDSITVYWWRKDEQLHDPVLYAFTNGQRQRQKEDPTYSWRTDLAYSLKDKDASLRIRNLTLEDAGCYVCDVESDGYSSQRHGMVDLSVAEIHMVIPKSNVTGPFQRDVVLPCHFYFESKVLPASISVNWWRNESGNHTIIYAYEHGQRQRQKEDPVYSNRTDQYYNLKEREASLTLQNLTLEDAGLYVCEVWSEGYSDHGLATVSLAVAAKPSTVNLISKEDKGLSFQSIGWFPKPLVYWTNENDQNVSDSADTDISLGTDGLYSIKTILHLDTDLNTHKLYLSYINPDTGEKQTDVFLQKPTVPGSGPSLPGIFIGGIISGVFWVLIILCALGALKCQRQTSSNSTSRASYELLEGSEWEQPSSGIHLRLNRRDSTSSYNVEPPLM